MGEATASPANWVPLSCGGRLPTGELRNRRCEARPSPPRLQRRPPNPGPAPPLRPGAGGGGGGNRFSPAPACAAGGLRAAGKPGLAQLARKRKLRKGWSQHFGRPLQKKSASWAFVEPPSGPQSLSHWYIEATTQGVAPERGGPAAQVGEGWEEGATFPRIKTKLFSSGVGQGGGVRRKEAQTRGVEKSSPRALGVFIHIRGCVSRQAPSSHLDAEPRAERSTSARCVGRGGLTPLPSEAADLNRSAAQCAASPSRPNPARSRPRAAVEVSGAAGPPRGPGSCTGTRRAVTRPGV